MTPQHYLEPSFTIDRKAASSLYQRDRNACIRKVLSICRQARNFALASTQSRPTQTLCERRTASKPALQVLTHALYSLKASREVRSSERIVQITPPRKRTTGAQLEAPAVTTAAATPSSVDHSREEKLSPLSCLALRRANQAIDQSCHRHSG